MQVSGKVVKFYIEYPDADTSVSHAMLHTQEYEASWGLLIKLAKWYNGLDANEQQLVHCMFSCDEQVNNEHVKTAFREAQIRSTVRKRLEDRMRQMGM